MTIPAHCYAERSAEHGDRESRTHAALGRHKPALMLLKHKDIRDDESMFTTDDQ